MGSLKVCGIYMDNDYGISLHLLQMHRTRRRRNDGRDFAGTGR